MIVLSSLDSIVGALHAFLEKAAAPMPPEAWWIPALVLLVLGAAAAVDACTALVPDLLIFPGLLALTALQVFYVSWSFAARHLGWGLGCALAVWALNAAWFALFKRDALGMGDAKWTMLAVAGFGFMPVLIAWGLGACLAVLWIGAAMLARRPATYVHFAPFLFVGLLAGLWWGRV